jgi:phenylacetic acid degradation operon negative regulatory protein
MLPSILARLRAQPSRTGSLIITLYGDAIAPRGGVLWLGTLLEIFRALDIGDGVVRTAVSRLAADGWLTRLRQGRNSFYRLAERGQAETDAATPRIYGPLGTGGAGRFRIVFAEQAAREEFARAGYGTLQPGVMIAPAEFAIPGRPDVLALAAETDLPTARALAARAWPLADTAGRYSRFLAAFAEDPGPLSDLDALLARLLLIHEYRRAVLRDPHLPADLLPPGWPGHAARARCATLYAALVPPSESWLDAHGRDAHGPLPPADPALRRRFG